MTVGPTVTVTYDGEQPVVGVAGEIDLWKAPELSAAIERPASPSVIVSLVECRYLDSTILTVLVQQSDAREGRLFIVLAPAHRLRRIFEIAKLDTKLDLRASLVDALAAATAASPAGGADALQLGG